MTPQREAQALVIRNAIRDAVFAAWASSSRDPLSVFLGKNQWEIMAEWALQVCNHTIEDLKPTERIYLGRSRFTFEGRDVFLVDALDAIGVGRLHLGPVATPPEKVLQEKV